MNLFRLFCFLIPAILAQEDVEVNMEGEKVAAAAPKDNNCEAVCEQAVAYAVEPWQKERDRLFQDVDRLRAEVQDAQTQLQTAISERDALLAEKEALLSQVSKIHDLHSEVERHAQEQERSRVQFQELRQSLDKSRQEAMRLTELANGHEETSSKLAGDLTNANRKIAMLEQQLASAQEEIKELSSVNFVKQLQKELTTLWNAILAYFEKFKKKQE